MKIYKSIKVHKDGEYFGVLMDTDKGSIFRYNPYWKGAPLSWSVSERFSDEAAQKFFTNLLPEKPRDKFYTEFSRLSFDRLAQFFEKYGSDLLGNISVGEAQSRDITRKVEKLVTGGQPLDDLMLRLSLPGGEPKIAVIWENGRFYSPGENPSTHILKSSNLTLFEAWAMAFAKTCGLDVVDTRLLGIGDKEVLLVERFDRVRVDGKWRRLQQEDFCQQLGRDSSDKYCVHGQGVDTKDMAKVMLERLPKEDIEKFLRATIFSMMIGNLDDHAKNYAVVTNFDGSPRLAPLYDITCVTAIREIGRKELFDGFSRYAKIGLQLPRIFGGERLPGKIHPIDFVKMGKFFNLEGSDILRIWQENTENILNNLESFNEHFMSENFGLSKQRFDIKNEYSLVIKTHIFKRMELFLRIQEIAEKAIDNLSAQVAPHM